MSLVASFSILPAAERTRLLELSLPELRTRRSLGLFTRTERVDRFPEFITSAGTQYVLTEASGSCVNALELYYEAVGLHVTELLFPPTAESEKLTSARGVSVGYFDTAAATRAAAFLQAHPLEPGALGAFLAAEYGAEAPPEGLIAVTRERLIGWLCLVGEGQIAVLAVG